MPGSGVRRTLSALVLGAVVLVESAGTAAAWTTAYGHVNRPDGLLRAGCHRYRYHYLVEPGSNDWILETWLHDPRGKPRGAGDFAPRTDPKNGYGTFGICRSTVVPGRFKITARLRWWTQPLLPIDPPVEHTAWFKPDYFRLTRP